MQQSGEVKQRDRSIDLARSLALIFMVTVHVLIFLGFYEESQGGKMACALVSLVGAPTFMFLMGMCFTLSSKTSMKVAVVRGGHIFALGYLLNILRGTFPVDLATRVGVLDPGQSLWRLSVEVDVLQCAGICLVIMAVVRKYAPWRPAWALLAIGSVAGIYIPMETSAMHSVGAYCSALFCGATEDVYFPVLPWIAFPLAGMVYGAMQREAVDKRLFEIRAVFVGLGLVLVVIFIGADDAIAGASDTFHLWSEGFFLDGKLTPGLAFTFLGVQLLWLPICGFIARTVGITRATQRLYLWSENVTLFYFIQWIVVGWLCVFVLDLPDWALITMIAFVLFLTDASVNVINRSRARYRGRGSASTEHQGQTSGNKLQPEIVYGVKMAASGRLQRLRSRADDRHEIFFRRLRAFRSWLFRPLR